MESTNRLYKRSGGAGHPALEDLHRLAWETMRDLGLSESEIASYFGPDLDRLKTVPGFEAMREREAS